MNQLGPPPSRAARIATRIEQGCELAARWSVPEATLLVTLFGLYSLLGVAAVHAGVFHPGYAFLSWRDPVFNTFGTLTGLVICQGTGALVVVAMMDGVRTVRDIVSVLAAFVGFGIGASLIRLTMHRTLRFFLELLR